MPELASDCKVSSKSDSQGDLALRDPFGRSYCESLSLNSIHGDTCLVGATMHKKV
jgi:hypothetical protein